MLNLDGLDEEKINKLQSHIRKNHVKNEMLKVRDEYEKIFYEIEGPNSDTKLEWPSKENTIRLPKFVSKRSAGREQITENNTSNKSSQLIKDTKEVNSSTAAKSQDNELVPRIENKPSGGGVESEIDFEQIKYLQLKNLKNMDKNELLSIREGISLELLWIEQAIQSRVQYLKLKKSIQQQKNQKKLTSSQ